MADWLRQRETETDAAWIERLRAVFAQELAALPDDPKADRIGERLWRQFQAQRGEAVPRDK